MVSAMANWFPRHAAVCWALLFLFVATSSGQTVDRDTEISTEETVFADITTEDYEITTESFLRGTNSADTQRSERMVAVYVKPDPAAETRNISDFLDYGDVIVKTGDNHTIVVTNPEENEYEEGDDGDVMRMAGRSLRNDLTEDLLAFESTKQPLPVLEGNDLKYILHKWNSEFDFNVTDLYKINLASVFAKEYNEMSRLINENLVEDTEVFAGSKGMEEGLEPRDLAVETDDLDMAVEATEEVMGPQVLPPPSTTPRLISTQARPSSQQRLQYTYQGRTPMQSFPGQIYHRSDTGSSYILLPRTPLNPRNPEMKPRPGFHQTVTGKPVFIRTDASALMLPGRQPSTATPPRIRRPQSTTAPPSGRFGERFANRLPRPFQRLLNMTMGSRQTTTEAPKTFYSSLVPHLPASSVNYPSRVRAPSYVQQSNQNRIPARNRLPVVTTTPRPRVSTEPSRNEFGARIRPSRIQSQRSSTLQVKEATKEQREVKISQLRSNLVGKLVVIQTMLENKEKAGKPEKNYSRPHAVPFNGKVLPSGLLKPIIPLRPRINVATTTTPITTTEEAAEEVSTVVWKDKKKYRRPPSFRKGNHNVKEATTPETQRESAVDFTIEDAVNTTETSVKDYEPNSTRPSAVDGATALSNSTDNKDPSVQTHSTETSTETRKNDDEAVTLASEVTRFSVETSSPVPIASATDSKIYEETVSTPSPIVAPQTVPTPVATNSTEELEQTDDREEITIVPESVENSSSVENATETLTPSGANNSTAEVNDLVVELSSTENLTVSVENSAEKRVTTTYAPEDDPYLKAMIERALQVRGEVDPETIQGSIPDEDDRLKYLDKQQRDLFRDLIRETEEDFEDDDDVPAYPAEFPEDDHGAFVEETQTNSSVEDDRRKNDSKTNLSKEPQEQYAWKIDVPEEDLKQKNYSYNTPNNGIKGSDLPDDENDLVIEEDEGILNNNGVLLRVDRSAKNFSKMIDRPEDNAVINLARGTGGINLPYNLLPDESNEARSKEDKREDERRQVQLRDSEVIIPQHNIRDTLNEAKSKEDERKHAEEEMQPRESEVTNLQDSYQANTHPMLARFVNKFITRFRS